MKPSRQVVIGVLTAAKYEERRRGVLATWGKDAAADPRVEFVFLIGDPNAKMPYRKGQTLYLPCPDDYESLPQKTRWFCLWALANYDAPWLFKADDDTYVRVDRLLNALDAETWTQAIVGCQDGDGDHFHGGAGYLISRDAAFLIAAHLTESTGLEDWKARDAVDAGGMWFEHDARFCFDQSIMPFPTNEQITCHYCSPLRMRLIHDAFVDVPAEARMSLPKVIHHTWLGGQPLQDRLAEYRRSWARHHLEWEMKLWTEDNLGPLLNQRQFEVATTPAQKSHIARYEILYREGGVYVDCDVECRRPIDDLLCGVQGLVGAEDDEAAGIAVMAAMPRDPLLSRIIAEIPKSFQETGDPPCDTGSRFFTKHLLADDSWRVIWWDKFYPVHYDGRVVASVEEFSDCPELTTTTRHGRPASPRLCTVSRGRTGIGARTLVSCVRASGSSFPRRISLL